MLGKMCRQELPLLLVIQIITVITLFNCVFSAPSPADNNDDEHYTTKFDQIDIDQILTNDRILKRYMDCLLDKGRCTPEARELKKVLPDALQTECKKCSSTQRKQGAKVIQFIIKHNLKAWNELLEKYDPEGNFRRKYNYKNEDSISDVLKDFVKNNLPTE